jgi:hypothetical protein
LFNNKPRILLGRLYTIIFSARVQEIHFLNIHVKKIRGKDKGFQSAGVCGFKKKDFEKSGGEIQKEYESVYCYGIIVLKFVVNLPPGPLGKFSVV